MASITSLIDGHLFAYGDPDRARRRDAVARLWTADGRLIDPPLAASGHAEIVAQSDALLSQFPGHTFRRSSGVDVHHDQARYAWRLVNASGETALEGVDFARVTPDGRLASVTGFFGPLPTLEAQP